MQELTIEIKTLSDTLIGSGEGWGAAIDTDIVFDECGLPYIPARRIKGCLRESALEVLEMFEASGMETGMNTQTQIDEIFGKQGMDTHSPIGFKNLYLLEYESTRKWLKWGMSNYPGIISTESIISTQTFLRQQTAIEDEGEQEGTAKEHSLRTIRVIGKDMTFAGTVYLYEESLNLSLLSLAVHNLRYIGTKRNRGFGRVECRLEGLPEADVVNALKWYEKKYGGEVCTS